VNFFSTMGAWATTFVDCGGVTAFLAVVCFDVIIIV